MCTREAQHITPSSIRTIPSAPAFHRIHQYWLAGLAKRICHTADRELILLQDLTLPRRLFYFIDIHSSTSDLFCQKRRPRQVSARISVREL